MLKINKFFLCFFLIFCSFSVFSFSGNSIYNLNSRLISYTGKILDFPSFSGKIQVFSMIYTRCKTVCPVIISNMKSIDKLLPEEIKNHVNFLLISLDPERDSVEVLNKFFNEKKFNKDTWNLCKTDKNETLRIALTAGIKYKKEKNDEYTHSNVIVILDKDGVIRMHHPGLDKNYNGIIDLIKSLI
ncbi:MAG TPA: SCO family protein [Candidatus Azoamicus sp.]